MTSNPYNAEGHSSATVNVRRNRKVAPATSSDTGETVSKLAPELVQLDRWVRRVQTMRLFLGAAEVVFAWARATRASLPEPTREVPAPLPTAEKAAELFATEVARVFPGVTLDPAALVAAGKVAFAGGAVPQDVATRLETLAAMQAAFGPGEEPMRKLFPDL